MAAPGARSRRLLPELIAVAALVVAAAPTPSPALGTILAAPPSPDYVEDTESSGTPVGAFDAGAYVGYIQPEDQAATFKALNDDGFVAGYGRSWTAESDGRALVEIVVAFSGGRGARRWLTTSEAMARSDQYYSGAIVISGLGPYAGVRYADPKAPSYADVVMFVKGNDFFLVGFLSQSATLGEAAATQSKLQYDFAPAASIPPSRWPENAGPSPRLPVPLVAAIAGSGILVAATAVVVVMLVVRRRDAATVSGSIPADAIRSGDGKLWWDGKEWRPVPPTG
jgi:hypothetical protein